MHPQKNGTSAISSLATLLYARHTGALGLLFGKAHIVFADAGALWLVVSGSELEPGAVAMSCKSLPSGQRA